MTRTYMSAAVDNIEKVYNKHGEAIRYLFFGGLNVIVTWVSYAVLVMCGVDPAISNAASWIIGVLFAFVVNKLYVFGSKSLTLRVVTREFFSFMGARVFTGIIAIVGFPILVGLGLNQPFMGVPDFIAKITVSCIEIALNYVLSKYFIFRKNAQIDELEKKRSM
ncbi:MAG: GtrA family protein [Kiritimatiellia bacterium]